MLKTHIPVKCEHCGKQEILQLLEYRDVGICIWLCKDCFERIEKRVDRIRRRIKRFILHPRGGKK